MIGFILAWMVSLSAGLAVTWGLLGFDGRRPGSWLLLLGLSVYVGLGLTSLSAMAHVVFLNQMGLPVLAGDLILLVVLVAMAAQLHHARKGEPWWWRQADGAKSLGLRGRVVRGLLIGWVGVVCLVTAGLAVLNLSRRPWGDWDAIMIWNLRARSLYRLGEQYASAFDPNILHADYPLMLSGSIYRIWSYQGLESPLATQSVSLATYLAIPMILGPVVAWWRGQAAGWLATIILLANPYLLNYGTLELADGPLAGAWLGAWAMLFVGWMGLKNTLSHEGASAMASARAMSWGMTRRQSYACFALAGLMLGSMAWTKNEGVLLLLVTGVGLWIAGGPGWWLKHGRGAAGMILLGMAPFALTLLAAKIGLAGSNDLVRGQTSLASAFHKLVDGSRHSLFWKTGLLFIQATPIVGVTLLFFLTVPLAGWRPGQAGRILIGMGLSILLAFAGYYVVYMLTPHDLGWHLRSSIGRLMTQLWPVFVLWAMLGLNLPWQTSTPFRFDPPPTV